MFFPKAVFKIFVLNVLFMTCVHSQVVIPPGQNQPKQQTPSQQMVPFDPSMLQQGQGMPLQGMNQQPQMALSEMLGEANLAPNEGIKRLPPLWPYYSGIAVLGLLVILLLIYLILKRKKKPKPIPFIPADIRALTNLDSLKPLIAEAKAREFSYKASEIMRSYIEERFGIEARNKTTREFLDIASKSENNLPDKHEKSLNEFLKYCDLAKFAKQVMQPEQLNNMFNVASEFIKDTRPSIMSLDHKNEEEKEVLS